MVYVDMLLGGTPGRIKPGCLVELKLYRRVLHYMFFGSGGLGRLCRSARVGSGLTLGRDFSENASSLGAQEGVHLGLYEPSADVQKRARRFDGSHIPGSEGGSAPELERT